MEVVNYEIYGSPYTWDKGYSTARIERCLQVFKKTSHDLSEAIRKTPEGTRIALKPIKFDDGKPDACILGIKFLKDEKFRLVFPMFSKSLTKKEARKAAKDLAEGIKAASTTKANTPAKTGSKLQVSA